MYGWIEPFYVPAEPAIASGHIWRSQPLRLPPRHALKIDRVDPKDDSKVNFSLSERTPDTFDHPPVHSLGLGVGEGAVLARTAREQPVVVLGGTGAADDRLGDAPTAIVLPLLPAQPLDAETRRRIAAYGFTNAFYLPAAAPVPESFARLDQAQPVLREHLVEHQGVMLAPDALDALVEWYVAFSTDRRPEGSLILEYRREMLAREP